MSLSDKSLRGPAQSRARRDGAHVPQSGAGGPESSVEPDPAAHSAGGGHETHFPSWGPAPPPELRDYCESCSLLAVRGHPGPSDAHQHAWKDTHGPLSGSGAPAGVPASRSTARPPEQLLFSPTALPQPCR